MKIAIVTDSNSGITQSKAKEMGVFVIPMPFMIDGEEYLEDINLSQDEFYKRLETDADVVTSQPSPQTVTDLWDEILKDYDEIVHIPMSSGLSGSCQTALMLAEDYDNKIFVVNNQRIAPTMIDAVNDAFYLIEKGYTGAQIKEELERTKFDSTIYITVGTLKYLKKGGRVTPAVAAIGTLLKIKPVLLIHGEKLDAFANARTMTQSKSIMINAVKKDMEKMIKCTDYSKYNINIAHSHDLELAEDFLIDLQKAFPGCEIGIYPLALSVACHIGPSSLAIAVSKKLEV